MIGNPAARASTLAMAFDPAEYQAGLIHDGETGWERCIRSVGCHCDKTWDAAHQFLTRA